MAELIPATPARLRELLADELAARKRFECEPNRNSRSKPYQQNIQAWRLAGHRLDRELRNQAAALLAAAETLDQLREAITAERASLPNVRWTSTGAEQAHVAFVDRLLAVLAHDLAKESA